MSTGLFDEVGGLRLPLAGGELLLLRGWLDASAATNYFCRLRQEAELEQSDIVIAGRRVQIPRLNAWYGDPGTDYRYSGRHFRPRPWFPALAELRERVQQTAAEQGVELRINSALVNLYRDGQDSVAWHSDDEPELGPRPQIASLSLGETRRFVLKPRRGQGEKVGLELEHGALLFMLGETQRHWIHALPKTRKTVGERINITFRQVNEVP